MDITGLGSIADLAGGILERVWPKDASPAEKAAAQVAIETALAAREQAVIEAQKSIMVAELEQSDAYTKRARPTVIYAGLLFIFLVHVIGPLSAAWGGRPLPEMSLPSDFWWAWSGVVGLYVIGRTSEKRGLDNPIVAAGKALIGGKK